MHKLRPILIFVVVALLRWDVASAQNPPEFAIVSMDAVLKGRNKFIDVFFTQPLDAAHDEDRALTGVTVEALPSKTMLTVVDIKRLGGDPTELEITLSGDEAPSDVQLKLTINRALNFRDGQSTRAANGPFTFTSTLIKDSRTLQDAMQKLADEMTRAGKSSQEKNIFASGFVTTGGETQGGADISLNSNDLGVPGLTSFMILRKTTSDGSDPKNFETGATFRATFLRGETGRTAVQNALNAYRAATTDSARQRAATDYNAAVVSFQRATLAAIFLDVTGKLEGQATNFNVTNGVADVSVKVQSRVKRLFGKDGFFHFQLLPLGFEGGSTLREPDSGTSVPLSATDQALQQLDGIVRLKAGATLNAFWQNSR
jgi:hypothetical protein